MKYILFICMLVSFAGHAQETVHIRVLDNESGDPIIGATVTTTSGQGVITDQKGSAFLRDVFEDTVTIEVSYVGYEAESISINLPYTGELVVRLHHDEELEEVIITTTRSSRTIDDVPTRIEAISSEELEEKSMMKSNNISMLLRESTGILMQQTSASSGNQSIRIQGLDGRYTQMLKNGFPLYGGFAGGLSIMQIPPLDLRQVEVIKGSNSTLFGGGAIAGLVNLVSHTPYDGDRLRFMLDQTTAGGTTFNTFYAQKIKKLGVSVFASFNRQQAYDSNNDDFSDIPRVRSLTLTPALFYDLNESSKLQLTLSGAFENRLGGDMMQIEDDTPGNYSFTEENESKRLSYQLVYENKVTGTGSFTLKNSLTYFDRKISEPQYQFEGDQWSAFTEASYNYGTADFSWISGVNLYTDKFIEDPQDTLRRNYQYVTFGAFTQNTWDINKQLALESGLRLDYDLDYGAFVLPRISLLSRFNEKLSARIGGGLGYKLPTIFTEDAENLTFEGILPINISEMEAEKSYGGNIDVNYKTAFGSDWTFSINQMFFYTQLNNALVLREAEASTYYYENADGPVTSQGLETNLKLTWRDFKLFANYALFDTKLRYDNLNNQKPLTPRHNIGAVLMYEVHGKWRVGYEAYYTGSQFRNDMSETSDFWIMGIMAMRKFNKLSIYVNFENMLDTRQHRLEEFDITDHIKPNFSDIWAPVDGRVINAGLIFDVF